MTASRGTTNRNDRGSSEDRRRRREWLVETYRADVERVIIRIADGDPIESWWAKPGDYVDYLARLATESGLEINVTVEPACRCYRCGKLLTANTVTVDRIVPGARGGTYRRNNIRPACAYCNSETGAKLMHAIRRAGVLGKQRRAGS